MRRSVTLSAACIFALLSTLLIACSSDDADDPRVKQAAHFLHEWLDVPESTFTFDKSEKVTWPNGCMGVEWPGRMCSQALVSGERLTFRTDNQGQQIVHTDERGTFVWAPIWEVETMIVRIDGETIEFGVTSGPFARLGLLVPGTTVEGTPAVGSRVYAAQSSSLKDGEPAPLVVLVVLD